MEEKIFFNEGGVSVSNARLIVHGQTYAMNAVTSVKQGVNHPSQTGPVLLGIFGLCVMAVGAANQNNIAALGIGLFLILGAMALGLRQKPEYIIVLSTSSGESQALKSPDKSYVDDVISALNNSIVHRG